VEQSGIVEHGEIGADVVAEAVVLAQGSPEPGTGIFAQDDIEQAESGGLGIFPAGGVEGDGELDLIDFAVFGDDGRLVALWLAEAAQGWPATDTPPLGLSRPAWISSSDPPTRMSSSGVALLASSRIVASLSSST
jgi:hypothetical protein